MPMTSAARVTLRSLSNASSATSRLRSSFARCTWSIRIMHSIYLIHEDRRQQIDPNELPALRLSTSRILPQ